MSNDFNGEVHEGEIVSEEGTPEPAPPATPPASLSQGVDGTQPILVMEARTKEVGIAYIFWFLLGTFGAHHFYLGKTGRGLFYLFTLGGVFWIGCIIDLFTLPAQTRQVNAEILSGARRL